MATTRDYIGYLGDRIDIAPVNSQEELQAAQVVQSLMDQHGLDVRLQEFDAPAWGGLPYRVLMIVMFLGVLLSGLQDTPVVVPGILLTLLCLALFVARWLGSDLIGNFGPRARSQNVVAVHRAQGPLVAKGNRPIVVVAHYDTPREGFLYGPQLAKLQPLVRRLIPYLVLGVGVAGLFQALGFLPSMFRRVLWLAGVVAALPLLVLGIGAIQERFSSCTDGANDNKASVAALLGVLNQVRPAPDAADGFEPELVEGGEVDDDEPEGDEAAVEEGEWWAEDEAERVGDANDGDGKSGSTAVVERFEKVVGIRHGADVLAELRILPESCEVVYLAPRASASAARRRQAVIVTDESPVAADAGESAAATGRVVTRGAAALSTVGERGKALFGRLGQRLGREHATEGPDAARDAAAGDEAASQGADMPGLAPDVTFSSETDPSDSEIAKRDMSGMDAVVDVIDPQIQRPVASVPMPAGIEDPSWGKSDFVPPQPQGVGRRAVLYDLPDPSAQSSDPLAPAASAQASPAAPTNASDSSNSAATARASSQAGSGSESTAPFNLPSAPRPVQISDDMALLTPLSTDEVITGAKAGRSTRRRRNRRGDDEPSMSSWLGVEDDYDARRNGRSMGSWDNFDTGNFDTGPIRRDAHWKGGASKRTDLRLVDDDDERAEEELREAVLSLGDDELIAHDIWFVALGASSLDHAGMRAFLREYRSQTRGSFVINLSCVGAGQLNLFTREGIDNPRRADRRMERLVAGIADDLHIELNRSPLDWGTTDATPAMRASMRAMTLVGLSDDGVPALSHTSEDVEDNVDPAQAAAVCDLVCEVIRRS